MSDDLSRSGAATGRLAVVTGGSGGIGREFARQLAAQGFDLLLVARNRDRLERLAEDLRGAYPVAVEILAADLSREDSLRVVERRIAGEPALELLVNCAGVASWGRFAELDLHREDETIRVNVLATMRLTRAAVPGMIERGRGGIINVSSLAALTTMPYCATYAGTKAFLTTFTESLHEELRGTGVKVQVLMPALVRTEMFARSGVDVNKMPPTSWTPAEKVVRSSLRALRRNQAICVPGTRFRLAAFMLRFAPRDRMRQKVAARSGLIETMRLAQEPHSGEHREP